MADFKVDSKGNGGAAPLYFGLGPFVKFLIDKIVLPSALSTTGLEEFNQSPAADREARIREGARIAALTDAEYFLEMQASLEFRSLPSAEQQRLVQFWNNRLTMPPMWNRDP